jgi:ATP-dependent Clp protease, protease subunit
LNTLITEMTEHGEMPIDIFTKLAKDRILFISDYIDDRTAADITATLLLKNYEENSDEKLSLFINSEGGNIHSVFAIYDMMQLMTCPLETICVGSAMNEIVLLLAAGDKGSRFATPNAVICCSQLMQEKYYRADLLDAQSITKRVHNDNKQFLTALAKKIGKKVPELSVKLKQKVFMNAKQAKSFGIVDHIMGAK